MLSLSPFPQLAAARIPRCEEGPKTNLWICVSFDIWLDVLLVFTEIGDGLLECVAVTKKRRRDITCFQRHD